MNEPREKKLAKNGGVKHYKLDADNCGSHAGIIMTSNSSTLTMTMTMTLFPVLK